MSQFNYVKFSCDIALYREIVNKEKGVYHSLRFIADESGVSRNTISLLLRGRSISMNSVIKLAEWAELNISDYVEYNKEVLLKT